MKLYVDELPKSCGECFCNDENTWCALSDGEMGDICEECDNKTRHKKCPLKTITEHDKQVRKEVCEEIKEKLRKQYPTVYANIGESLFCSDCYLRIRELSEILNQIQGENK